VSNIEGARRRLGVLEALQVCEALGCSVADLLEEYERRHRAGK
jgi:hypothetical protein